MGERGPKPKPTRMRVLEGNPSKRPLPQNEPMPDKPERTPSVPSWLPENAKAIWKQYARQLWELGLLTGIDVEAYATLCETTALYRTAVDMIQEQGAVWVNEETGYSQQTAWVSIRNNALKQAQSLWSEFGMTPAARTRVEVDKGEEKEVDKLTELLNERASRAAVR